MTDPTTDSTVTPDPSDVPAPDPTEAAVPADSAADAAATDPDAAEVTVVGAAMSDGAYTLFVADFDDTSVAWEAYEALKSIEDGATVEIEGVVVVKRELDGELKIQKATDHSTRRGLTWGLVGGALLGIVFPPSILGTAAVAGVVGAAAGRAVELHHRSELAEELENSVIPGHSAIVALVSDPGAVEIRKALTAANAIVESTVDRVVARDLKALAKDAQSDEAATTNEAAADESGTDEPAAAPTEAGEAAADKKQGE